MNDFLRDLVSIAPVLTTGLAGNGADAAALMEGFERARREDEQRQRIRQQDSLALQDRNLALEDRQRNITRQQAADAAAAEARRQQQALQSFQIPAHLAELGSVAEDPQGAQALIEGAMPALMKAFGQEAMAYGMPAVELATRTITGRQKKQVEQYIDAALKTSFVVDHPDADPEMVNLPEHIRRIVGKPAAKLSELQSFAQLPIGKPAGRPSDEVSWQRDELLVNGVPTVVFINPKTREIKNQAGETVSAAPIPPKPTGGDAGLNANQAALLTERLAKSWNDANASGREMRRQLGLMQTGLRRFREGDKNGGSQAVLVTFQKILDPTSVVRESEYARSAQGISMLGRIQGYIERLEAGGAGVPDAELAGMVETARQMLAEMSDYSSGQRSRIEAVAKKHEIDPVLIFGMEPARSGGGASALPSDALPPMAPVSSRGTTRLPSNPPADSATAGSDGRPPAAQLRERRKFGNDLREWNGSRWVLVTPQ